MMSASATSAGFAAAGNQAKTCSTCQYWIQTDEQTHGLCVWTDVHHDCITDMQAQTPLCVYIAVSEVRKAMEGERTGCRVHKAGPPTQDLRFTMEELIAQDREAQVLLAQAGQSQ